MSGHNKWSTIKRKKGAADAKRGKIFTRLGRDITIAAREGGGGNPDANPRLRLAIAKARASSMPKENIERAIARGTGQGEDAVQIEEITYEGYGPHGVAILIDALTDNKNRTISQVRATFTRANGSMASEGSVAWQFERKGYVELTAEGVDADELFLVAADAGADDVIPGEETITVYTARDTLAAVESALAEKGYNVTDSGFSWIAKNEVELEKDDALQVMGLLERLEELEDVQGVASNLNITEELAKAMETA